MAESPPFPFRAIAVGVSPLYDGDVVLVLDGDPRLTSTAIPLTPEHALRLAQHLTSFAELQIASRSSGGHHHAPSGVDREASVHPSHLDS